MTPAKYSSEISFSLLFLIICPHHAKGISVDQQTLPDLEADQRNIPGRKEETSTSSEGPIQSFHTL